ncbi:MAG TPA: homoserine kinase, partial [Pusillimonas sp.]|nr:homoserine kinase [Pusillimonas sp.]
HRNTGEFDQGKAHAWLQAYAQVRPFSDAEQQAWPLILQSAALRFWVSRLYDYFLPRPAQTLKPHDPRHFEVVLQARRNGKNPELPTIEA